MTKKHVLQILIGLFITVVGGVSVYYITTDKTDYRENNSVSDIGGQVELSNVSVIGSEVSINNIDNRVIADENSTVIKHGDITINQTINSKARASDQVKYLIEISVDKLKTSGIFGRGWDWPFQQPDPYPCIRIPNKDEKTCFDYTLPEWNQCVDTFKCKVFMLGPDSDQLEILIYDKDKQESDFVGSGKCRVGEMCRLANSKPGYNSGTIKITKINN